jgi:hypothetical protein
MIASVVGAGASLIGGAQADNRNNQLLGQQQQGITAQQNLIRQLMAGMDPSSYQQQASLATSQGLGGLAQNFAGRGMLDSGAFTTAATNAAASNASNASAAYQRDRLTAYQTAMSGQQGVSQQYANQMNPNPYGGLGAALGGLGTAAGSYFANSMAGVPAQGGALGTPSMAGFGVSYASPSAPGGYGQLPGWAK